MNKKHLLFVLLVFTTVSILSAKEKVALEPYSYTHEVVVTEQTFGLIADWCESTLTKEKEYISKRDKANGIIEGVCATDAVYYGWVWAHYRITVSSDKIIVDFYDYYYGKDERPLYNLSVKSLTTMRNWMKAFTRKVFYQSDKVLEE